jgi:hypothetical protein
MATPLAQSMAEPPPTAMSPSQRPLRYMLDGRAHGGFGGVGGRLVEHRHLEIGDGVQRLLQHAGRAHAGVGHDQRAVMPMRAHSLDSSLMAPNSNWIWVR